jgi:hypothetical protein
MKKKLKIYEVRVTFPQLGVGSEVASIALIVIPKSYLKIIDYYHTREAQTNSENTRIRKMINFAVTNVGVYNSTTASSSITHTNGSVRTRTIDDDTQNDRKNPAGDIILLPSNRLQLLHDNIEAEKLVTFSMIYYAYEKVDFLISSGIILTQTFHKCIGVDHR